MLIVAQHFQTGFNPSDLTSSRFQFAAQVPCITDSSGVESRTEWNLTNAGAPSISPITPGQMKTLENWELELVIEL